MKQVARWVLFATLGCLVAAQTVVDDPVMKARSQRAAAQGIQEDDLPPVPRSIMEPPPLPPPEIHAKDLPQPRVAKPAKRGKAGRAARRAAAAAADGPTAAPAGKRAKAKAKAGKRVRPAVKSAPPAGRVSRKAGKRGKA